MPPADIVPNGDAAQPAANARRGSGMVATIIRLVMMWYMMKTFFGKGAFWGGGGPSKPGKEAAGPAAIPLSPKLPRGVLLDAHFYLSELPLWQDAVHGAEPAWLAAGVPLAGGVEVGATVMYSPSAAVQHNGSVWVHAVFTPPGAAADPASDFFDAEGTFAVSHALNQYLPLRRAAEGTNLLTGKNTTDDTAPPPGLHVGGDALPIVSYLKPNVTLSMVNEFGVMTSGAVPPHYRPHIALDTLTQTYAPILWFNDFWLLREYLVPVNETLAQIPIHLSITTLSPWKFAIFTQMEQSFTMQKQWGSMREGETDDLKRVFLEGNPIFLGLTMVVSLLHSVFDMLAFKNDIGFWKNNKSMKGLSARTILINCVCQLIIFLYLLDNETSFVVLMSSGVGTAIEFWKVTKAMNVTLDRRGRLPRIRFRDRASYSQSQTDRYDAEAMRYLSYVLYPLVVGYAIYALAYQTHKSWYSWVLNSLVGAVYTFGFILMCPQLYLNYKLKSVAHLPWRQMTYKFLNTIIDDLFAFVIKMPLLHRLSVFRDDIVFLVQLYQRWIYRVDRTRTNEFGYVEEEGDEAPEAVPLEGNQQPVHEESPAYSQASTDSRGEQEGKADEEQEPEDETTTESKKDK